MSREVQGSAPKANVQRLTVNHFPSVLVGLRFAADVQPVVAILIVFQNALVEVGVLHQVKSPLEQGLVLVEPFEAVTGASYHQIGGFSTEMLGVAHTAYRSVEGLATVTGTDDDRLAGIATKWLQHLLAQVANTRNVALWNGVVNT